MKWYQDDKGNISTMRILSMAAGLIGILISLSGTIAMFMNKPSATTAISVGAGLIGIALGAKAGQKFAEGGND